MLLVFVKQLVTTLKNLCMFFSVGKLGRYAGSFLLTITAVFTAALLFFSLSSSRDKKNDIKPDDNRFTKIILTENLDEPMEMTFLPGSKVLIVERKGGVKLYDPKSDSIKLIAKIPVNTFYINSKGKKRPAEEGLMGVIADPFFKKNNRIYMYYADSLEPKHVLARWELINDKLVESSKKIILEVPIQREESCCTGGGMVFDAKGNLFLTVGSNTVIPPADSSSTDDEPVYIHSDELRTAGNTNDLRGKILRIIPTEDGSYAIPDGNLFPKGLEKTRPEIYIMGTRNPWRPSVDNKTGYLFWGDPGRDEEQRHVVGLRGFDEFNRAKSAGNFGWPLFIADNKLYKNSDVPAANADRQIIPEKPVNNSPNNTGLRELPPANKAMIWYPYALSDSFPLVGSSGRSAVGGPVFRRSDFPEAQRRFPDYYEGKWFITDFMRGWIMAVSMDENGDYVSMEQFLPTENFGSAIDMDFSPDGDLYILEYGTAWFQANTNARLVRIEYNAGNRKPKVEISADKTKGAVPFRVKLSAAGTIDYDNDSLQYEWKISGSSGSRFVKQANPVIYFDKPGKYNATLTVTDIHGGKSSRSIEILAGNEPPDVTIDIVKGNRTFYFPNDTIRYNVHVSDKEDGSIANGRIKPQQVAVSIDFLPVGYLEVEPFQLNRSNDINAFASTGQILISMNDCKSCHLMDKKSVGPSYLQIAQKYKGNKQAVDKLASKVIHGGSGVWGSIAMSAHPQISKKDAQYIVEYILSVGEKKTQVSLPLKGNYVFNDPRAAKGEGTYVLRSAYRDRGTSQMHALTGEQIHLLRSPVLYPEKADIKKGAKLLVTPSQKVLMEGDNSFLGYRNIDLSNLKQISLIIYAYKRTEAGGIIELRLDAPNGKLAAKSKFFEIVNDSEKKRETFELQPELANGKHDLYFVFKNEQAGQSQALMYVYSIEFKK